MTELDLTGERPTRIDEPAERIWADRNAGQYWTYPRQGDVVQYVRADIAESGRQRARLPQRLVDQTRSAFIVDRLGVPELVVDRQEAAAILRDILAAVEQGGRSDG